MKDYHEAIIREHDGAMARVSWSRRDDGLYRVDIMRWGKDGYYQAWASWTYPQAWEYWDIMDAVDDARNNPDVKDVTLVA